MIPLSHGIADSKREIISAPPDLVDTYIARVEADGGEIINETKLRSDVTYLQSINEFDNLLVMLGAEYGIRQDASNYVDKIFNVVADSSDYIQDDISYQAIFDTSCLIMTGVEWWGDDFKSRYEVQNFTSIQLAMVHATESLNGGASYGDINGGINDFSWQHIFHAGITKFFISNMVRIRYADAPGVNLPANCYTNYNLYHGRATDSSVIVGYNGTNEDFVDRDGLVITYPPDSPVYDEKILWGGNVGTRSTHGKYKFHFLFNSDLSNNDLAALKTQLIG